MAEAAGKQFVYGWFGSDQPVMPDPCESFSPPWEHVGQQPFGMWNQTNSCWSSLSMQRATSFLRRLHRETPSGNGMTCVMRWSSISGVCSA